MVVFIPSSDWRLALEEAIVNANNQTEIIVNNEKQMFTAWVIADINNKTVNIRTKQTRNLSVEEFCSTLSN